MGFSDKCFRHAVCFEAERAYRNVIGRSLRFNNFIPLCFRSKFPEKFLKNVDGYEKWTDGLIGNDRSREKFRENLYGKSFYFNATLAQKYFPCIKLGHFPSVELYDGITCYSETTESLIPQILEGCFPSHIDANWVDPNCLYHTPDSIYAEISNTNASYLLEEKVEESTMNSHSSDWKTERMNALLSSNRLRHHRIVKGFFKHSSHSPANSFDIMTAKLNKDQNNLEFLAKLFIEISIKLRNKIQKNSPTNTVTDFNVGDRKNRALIIGGEVLNLH
ncbi:hypothetical protein ACJIZ3_012519 [Penstemon smallii]|uniref:Uncharacterized protein n=1 Tax=Penstemon smallii TaxID=265156 RepID=A0ABD3UMA7_9LAMI